MKKPPVPLEQEGTSQGSFNAYFDGRILLSRPLPLRCGCTQEIAIGRGRKKHVYTWKCVEGKLLYSGSGP
ncbi:hypothetical protein F2P79_023666 [Pimephales promelas]|nr:hypothetical protein F2P79_023666 [Pimephales promelas]